MRRLNEASFVLLYFMLFDFFWAVFSFCSVFWFSTLILLAGSFLTCKTVSQITYTQYCVGGDIQPYSLTHSVTPQWHHGQVRYLWVVTDITTDVTLVTCGRHLKHIDYFIMNIRYICPDVRYTIANPLRGGGWVELVVGAWYSRIW